MDANRRRALSLLGSGLVSLSGCLAANGSESSSTPIRKTTKAADESPTRATSRGPARLPMGSTYEVGDRSVTVENARVQKSVEEFMDAWVQLASFPDSQFVIVDVQIENRAGGEELPRANEFAVEVDGEPNTADRTHVVYDSRSSEPSETFAFPVDIDPSPESVGIVWKPERVRWEVGPGVVAEVPNAPRFEIRSFSAPAETERGTDVTLSVTVANVGEADGTFRAEFGPTSYSHVGVISVDVPQGGTTTYEDSFRGYLEGEDDVSYLLDWGENALVRTVDVAEPATETGTPGRT